MPKGIYNRSSSKSRPRLKFLFDRDWLYNEYIIKDQSTPEIGKIIGASMNAVAYWLRKYKIPIKNRNTASIKKRLTMAKEEKLFRVEIDKDKLLNLFAEKRMTLNQIACHFETSGDTIRKRLLKYGVRIRQRDERGVRPRRTSGETRKFQRELLRLYGYKCAICGYDKFVNSCHIETRAYGGESSIKNGIVLCPNHHYELDFGIITREEIRKYQINKEKVRHSK
jgi:hypothetical protein